MAGVPQKTLNWLWDVLKREYHDPSRTYSDLAQALSSHPGLAPRTDVHTSENGVPALLLHLVGTIPVNFRGTTYRFPIEIWTPHAYPYEPPIFYVTPTEGMVVRPGQHVSAADGKVYHHYLAQWRDARDRSSMNEFLRVLADVFAKEPPVMAKPVGGPPPQTQPVMSRQQQQAGPSQPRRQGGLPPPPVPPLPHQQNTSFGQGPPPFPQGQSNGPPPPPPKQPTGMTVDSQRPGSVAPPISPPPRPGRYDAPPPLPGQPQARLSASSDQTRANGYGNGHIQAPGGMQYLQQQQPQQQQRPVSSRQTYSPPPQQPQYQQQPPPPPISSPGLASPMHTGQQQMRSPPSQQQQQQQHQYPQQSSQTQYQQSQGYQPDPQQGPNLSVSHHHPQAQPRAQVYPPQQRPQSQYGPTQPQYSQQMQPRSQAHTLPPVMQQLQQQPQQPKPKSQPKDLLTSTEDSPFEISLPSSHQTNPNIPAPPIPTNPEKTALLSHLSHLILQHLHTSISQTATTALPSLQSQHTALTTAQETLQSELSSLQNLHNQLSSNLTSLQTTLTTATNTITSAQSQQSSITTTPIDEIIIPPSVIARQLYDAVAEQRGYEASIWALNEAFTRGRVGSDVWGKKVREAAREEFRRKFLVRKIGGGLGLEGV